MGDDNSSVGTTFHHADINDGQELDVANVSSCPPPRSPQPPAASATPEQIAEARQAGWAGRTGFSASTGSS
jgi:hypothetical protein